MTVPDKLDAAPPCAYAAPLNIVSSATSAINDFSHADLCLMIPPATVLA
jgi:hypothetical protein